MHHPSDPELRRLTQIPYSSTKSGQERSAFGCSRLSFAPQCTPVISGQGLALHFSDGNQNTLLILALAWRQAQLAEHRRGKVCFGHKKKQEGECQPTGSAPSLLLVLWPSMLQSHLCESDPESMQHGQAITFLQNVIFP